MGFLIKKKNKLKLTIAAAVLAVGIQFGSIDANAKIIKVPKIDGTEISHVQNYVNQNKKDVFMIVYSDDGSLFVDQNTERQTYVYFTQETAEISLKYIKERLIKAGLDYDLKIVPVKFNN